MKALFLILPFILSLPVWGAATKTLEDFKIDCSGIAEIVNTKDFHYSPYVPPHFRVPAFPSVSSMKVDLKIISTSPGCEEFTHLYNYPLNFETVTLKADYEIVEKVLAANKLVGKSVYFDVKNFIKYKVNKKFFPYFPDFYDEVVSLVVLPVDDAKITYQGSVKLNVDSQQAYGVIPIGQKSDEQKLEGLKKLVQGSNYSPYSSFKGDLILQLEPDSFAAKQVYVKKIWAYLHSLKFNKNVSFNFFDFHVGGIGAFEGESLAAMVLKLQKENEVLTDEELVSFLVEFPTILIAGINHCTEIDDKIKQDVIAKIHSLLFVFTPSELDQVKDLISRMKSSSSLYCGAVESILDEPTQQKFDEIVEFLENK